MSMLKAITNMERVNNYNSVKTVISRVGTNFYNSVQFALNFLNSLIPKYYENKKISN